MKFIDLARETATATGSNPLILGGAGTGFRVFAPVGGIGYSIGEEVPYKASQGALWEIGTGTKTANGIERTTVTASTNGGALVNFVTGAIDVHCNVSAAFLTGVEAKDLAPAGALSGSDIIPIVQGGVEVRTTLTAIAAAVAAINGTPADTTAPTLSSPTGTATGTTTASGTVTTNEANGTLYFLAATGSTATATAVKAGGTQAITATGSKSVSVTGLTASTVYYLHYLHRDAAGNDSTVSTSASFTTSAAGDTTAPVLSAPLGTQTGSTTASGGATTNEANGTLYRMVSANATETAATIKAANLTSTVTATGAQVVSFTGLTASTTYYAHYVHRDAAGNDSNVVNSASFTTAAAVTETAYTITGYSDNTLKSPIDASAATVHGSLKQIINSMQGTSASYAQYWAINATTGGAQPASAECGWSTSSTVAPASVTQAANAAGSSSVNGLVPMGKATAFFNNANLWVAVGSGSTTWYFWIKPSDGAAQMIGSSTVTGA